MHNEERPAGTNAQQSTNAEFTTSAPIATNPMLCDALSLEGGKQLMGHLVEKWVNGKRGRFLSKGKIINYKKVKEKKGSLSIKGGKYLIEYSNGKCFWSRRCEFTIIK